MIEDNLIGIESIGKITGKSQIDGKAILDKDANFPTRRHGVGNFIHLS